MHADEHDLGLLHDLAVMRSRLNRRNALRLIGAAGAGLFLAACGSNKKSTAAAATTTTAATAVAGGSVATAPTETGGPFPADGTNGPNVLDESGVVRSDITKSFGQYSGTATGVPLTINLKVVKNGAAYSGAAVYLWHCDAQGRYTLYSQGATDQNYCRGVQAADSSGALTFKTVFPACYSGRWPHFHYEVFPSLSAAESASNPVLTSQIALPKDACEAVYADATAYPSSASNLQRVSLTSDMVFADSYQSEMGVLSGSPSSGYTMTFTIGV
jgi:protocatechuate 3,4-dioxygenase beta subunit